ncbi:MAG TPA: hypothetical protein VFC18_12845 [Burkholderiales bacterium]|nr:hypothetical protein [Burkholderiales bacterium]
MRTALTLVILLLSAPAWPHGDVRLGKVHFKVECNEPAQAQFNLAMAYYHSFAWSQMQAPLESVLQADPSCGMAHWARALASLNNPFAWPTVISPAALAEGPRILEQAERTGLRSERERAYATALGAFFAEGQPDHKTRAKALEAAFERLMQRYPRDEEAAVLYALFLSANFDPADKKYTNQLKAAKILEKISLDQPDHPGVAHYLIHSYDYPPIAGKGLQAARRYSKIAADAPHALHMPSHIFTRVGAWRESIEANGASAKAAGDKGFDKWHAYDYMVYAHLQLGEHDAARRIVDEAFANPARIDHPASAYAYAAMPARLALERAEWKTASSLRLAPDDFPWKKYTFAEAINAYARGLGAAMSGDAPAARLEAERLDALRAGTGVAYWAEQIAIQAEVVRGLALVAEGDGKQGISVLSAAAKREDATEKHAVTPGPLVPAREVLAYVRLEQKDAKGALREFEAVLAKEPNRLRALAGALKASERSGNRAKAKLYASKLPL